jgi:hypothetical protein
MAHNKVPVIPAEPNWGPHKVCQKTLVKLHQVYYV